jgi:hypothetical protein
MTTTQPITDMTGNNAGTVEKVVEYIDQVSEELYSKDEWESARGLDSLLGMLDVNLMIEEVIDKAFKQKPELFDNIRWFNDENGCPIWVRPDVEWEMEDFDND